MTDKKIHATIDPKEIGLKTAQHLLDIQAVHHRGEGKPFIFTSGWASPVYIDCRKIISFPKQRDAMMVDAVRMMEQIIGEEECAVIAGGETAGIPFAAFLAEKTQKPMIYVRKKPKGFGRNAQIEGDDVAGKKILLVEDLASDGRSKILFVDALREAGAIINHTFVVFHYGIFNAPDVLRAHDMHLHALATWWDILQAAKNSQYFKPEYIDEIESFLTNPVAWSAKNGGISELPRAN